MNMIDGLSRDFFEFLSHTTGLAAQELSSTELTLNSEEHKEEFGDMSSNAALILAKKLGRNPREIASMIVSNFKHPAIEKIEIAGPGFINLFFSYTTIQDIGRDIFINKEAFFKPLTPETTTINIEYVSANPTGPLHLGHGRGGIIGDVLAKVQTFLGNSVTREFYINDAGSQITKLGLSLLARCKQELGQEAELPEEGYQGQYLVEVAKQCIQEYGPSVIEKDLSFFKTYAKEMLLDRINTTLKEYGIEYDVWFSEKTLHDSGAIEEAVKILEKNGHLYKDENALWFKSTAFGDDKDRVLKKSDGSYTYVAADIAYMLDKMKRGSTKLIFVLGQDHHSYVQRLKGLIQALGYSADHVAVILYQLVTLKESGEALRMSKRAGRMITLNDVIETVGTDVARFFYLNKKADAHLEFDIDLALKKSEENPVYYLQYAYVRTHSILEKAKEIAEPIKDEHATLLGMEEKLLIKKIASLKILLKNIGNNYQTHLLTYYTLDLAQCFHRYYAVHRVLDPENKETMQARLLLVKIVHETLKFCFDMMGISAPEKM